MAAAVLYLSGSLAFLAGTILLGRSSNGARVLYGLGSLAFAAGTLATMRADAPRVDTCSAPCLVRFDADTREDEYREDFSSAGLLVFDAGHGR